MLPARLPLIASPLHKDACGCDLGLSSMSL